MIAEQAAVVVHPMVMPISTCFTVLPLSFQQLLSLRHERQQCSIIRRQVKSALFRYRGDDIMIDRILS